MKNNSDTPSNNQITKQDLKDLRHDISKDFGKVINDVLIQIENRLNNQDKKIDAKFEVQDKKFNIKFKELDNMFENKFDSKFNKLRRDLLDSNLQIAEELRLSREERAALSYRQSIHTDQLENHDSRITFLEKN